MDCPEVMGSSCLITEEVAAAIKGLNILKTAGPTDVMSVMMKASGDLGIRWIDRLTTLSKKAVFQMSGERLP